MIPHTHELDGELHDSCPNCAFIRFKLSPLSLERWGEEIAYCTRGHEWEKNMIINSQGHRICHSCRLENSRRLRDRGRI